MILPRVVSENNEIQNYIKPKSQRAHCGDLLFVLSVIYLLGQATRNYLKGDLFTALGFATPSIPVLAAHYKWRDYKALHLFISTFKQYIHTLESTIPKIEEASDSFKNKEIELLPKLKILNKELSYLITIIKTLQKPHTGNAKTIELLDKVIEQTNSIESHAHPSIIPLSPSIREAKDDTYYINTEETKNHHEEELSSHPLVQPKQVAIGHLLFAIFIMYFCGQSAKSYLEKHLFDTVGFAIPILPLSGSYYKWIQHKSIHDLNSIFSFYAKRLRELLPLIKELSSEVNDITITLRSELLTLHSNTTFFVDAITFLNLPFQKNAELHEALDRIILITTPTEV